MHRCERLDLGGEQRVVVGVAESLAQLGDVAGGGGRVITARRGGLAGVRRVPHRERRERRLVTGELERRALARRVRRVDREQRAAVEAAVEREDLRTRRCRSQLIRHSANAFSFDSAPDATNVTCGKPGTSWRNVFA